MFKRFMRQQLAQLNAAKKSNSGFTLIELLVVIVILGFLIGMIAPRLASIIDDKIIDTICHANQRGATQYIDIFRQQEGRYPSGLINLVVENGDDVFLYSDLEWDEDPETAGIFDDEFGDHLKVANWQMNKDERDQLRSLGITTYRMLNDYRFSGGDADDVTPKERLRRQRVTALEDGDAAANVLMVGAARMPLTGGVDADGFNWPVGSDIAIPEFIGSFVFGLGETSELVTGGYVQNSALCPESMQGNDNILYGYYSLVLPRLQATSTRLFGDNSVFVKFVAEDVDTRTEIFELSKGMPEWKFAVVCPEGHVLGVEVEEWDFVGAADTYEDAADL